MKNKNLLLFTLLVLGTLSPSFALKVEAATTSGTVVAWGDNTYGQLNVPADLGVVTAVAAGYYHSLALKSDGTVVAWGYNPHGETNVPAGLSGVVAVAAGPYVSLALKSDGTVVVWGNNTEGQLNVPAGLSGVVAVSGFGGHILALKSDGTVVAWGDNTYGAADVPAGLSEVVAVASGGQDSLALKSDGTVVEWGRNLYGEANVPTGLTGVGALSAGSFHTLALKSDGTVVQWGANTDGQFPLPLEAQSGVTAVSAGAYFSLALKGDATVVAWGRNLFGEATVPPGLSGVVAVSAGGNHSLALVAAGAVDYTPPTAIAGLDQNIRAGHTVLLDGSASFDDNTASTALLYSWSFSARPSGSIATLTGASTATPSFVADVTGTYVIQLVVTDGAGLSSTPDYVICSSANLAPSAVATVDFNLVIIGETAHLNGSASTDPELDPLSYSWTITAKPLGSTAALVNAASATPTLTPDMEGVYQATLVVSDFIGPGNLTTVQITSTTAAGFAEFKIVIASGLISGLTSSQITTKGNQTALLNFLSQAMVALQHGNVATAIEKLQKSIERTDGCTLRGSPDGNGAGRDWITNCVAQFQVYALLNAALGALTP